MTSSSIVLTLLSYIAGFLTAIFAEPIRQWIYKPELKLEFENSLDFITKTPEQSQRGEYQACYIRVKVTNIKPRIAKGCRAYLVNIERDRGNGHFEQTDYCDSIQLGWSCMAEKAHEGIDLPRVIPQFIDVVSVRDISTDFKPEIRVTPIRYFDLFKEKGLGCPGRLDEQSMWLCSPIRKPIRVLLWILFSISLLVGIAGSIIQMLSVSPPS